MEKQILLILSLLFLTTSCVKEAGEVTDGDQAGTTGTTGGGGTTGSIPTPGLADPLASQAWHLKNTAQNSFSTGHGTSGEDISLSDVDPSITGAGVRIAVSDSGTDIDHEDLTGNQLVGEHRNYAVANPDQWRGTDPYVVADEAHGTATAGLVAAVGFNGLGSRGVAHGAKFAGFRYISIPAQTASSQLARDIDQADGNFDIFNYSYGYPQCFHVENDELALEAFSDGAKNLRNGRGAVYVQSAGNSYAGYLEYCLGIDNYPGVFAGNTNHSDDLAVPEKIITGAINAYGLKSSYSTPGSGVWVSAPGGEYGTTSPAMVTTDISGCNHGYSFLSYALNAFNRGSTLNPNCSYTSTMNGTSSAAPVTAGVVALMLQANPSLSWRDVKHILALTSDEVDYSLVAELYHPLGDDLPGHVYDMKWVQNAAGIDYSNWYGFGRVNALNAVLMSTTYNFPLGAYESTANPNSGQWYYDSGSISMTIPNDSPVGTAVTGGTVLNVKHNFFVESVQLDVSITHGAPKELAISLISPSGTESRLLNVNSGIVGGSFPSQKLLLSNAFYGEESLGNWRIHVVDGSVVNGGGTLTNWKIKINGHRIAGDGSYPNPVTSVTMPATFPASGTNSVTPPVTFNLSTSTDVLRYEMSVGTVAGAPNVAAWTSIGLNHSSVQLTQLTLTQNTNYYVNIRAIDNRENASAVVSRVWQTN